MWIFYHKNNYSLASRTCIFELFIVNIFKHLALKIAARGDRKGVTLTSDNFPRLKAPVIMRI